MNFIRFNRPVQANPLTSAIDEFFQKGISELANSNFSFNRPSVNIIEEDEAFHIQLAAPGLKKEDFNIKVDKDQLIVAVAPPAKEEVTEEKEEKNYRRREFNFNAFTRSFHLPETINTDSIEATYIDGVLTIALNKKEEAKEKEPRLIAIS